MATSPPPTHRHTLPSETRTRPDAGKYPTHPSPPVDARATATPPGGGVGWGALRWRAGPAAAASLPMPSALPGVRCARSLHLEPVCLVAFPRRVPALLLPSFSSFHLDHPPRHRHCRPAALEARTSGARRPKPSPSCCGGCPWLAPPTAIRQGEAIPWCYLPPSSGPASGFRRCPPVTPPLTAFRGGRCTLRLLRSRAWIRSPAA
ncbi:hypothetical protein PAHAL_3G233600 [Panicum hallii]|uniref:Uncharacterized protein n=1 Tax=Panicum hallii TaxID=206008 RepID=A0A2T8KJ74_9POAL|nr:hypothetical protein PAHAL_3G233600 [Panicum hallii]